MRNDAAKLFNDPPKRGSVARTRNNKQNQKKSGLPNKESMTKHACGWDNNKEQTFNYKAVRRFLDKSVGRPWNCVYSDLCEQFKGLNRELIKQYTSVIFDCHVKDDGKVYENTTYYRSAAPTLISETTSKYKNLYVHPVTGIFTKSLKLDKVPFCKNQPLITINGVKYNRRSAPHTGYGYKYKRSDVRLEPKPYSYFEDELVYESSCYNYFLFTVNGCWHYSVKTGYTTESKLNYLTGKQEKYELPVYRTKQLNKKELKSFGLKNRTGV